MLARRNSRANVCRDCGTMSQDPGLIFWYPVPGSRVPGTRPLGARFGGMVVTSIENVDFWYRYVGTVVTGAEIVDFGYPKYRDSGAFGGSTKLCEPCPADTFAERS